MDSMPPPPAGLGALPGSRRRGMAEIQVRPPPAAARGCYQLLAPAVSGPTKEASADVDKATIRVVSLRRSHGCAPETAIGEQSTHVYVTHSHRLRMDDSSRREPAIRRICRRHQKRAARLRQGACVPWSSTPHTGPACHGELARTAGGGSRASKPGCSIFSTSQGVPWRLARDPSRPYVRVCTKYVLAASTFTCQHWR